MFVAVPAVVVEATRPAPNFVRITLDTSDEVTLGSPIFDQRIKVILPSADGTEVFGEDWFTKWQALPDVSRGAMRTYSVRNAYTAEARTRLTIDFVVHEGSHGPASDWAVAAAPGDRITVVGPKQADRAGIEFRPGMADQVVLAGDETAAPAIARILEDLSSEAQGVAFIEVPTAGDALAINAPEGIRVTWLPREGQAHGARLIPAVLTWLGASDTAAEPADDVGDLVWETPTFSALGEDVVDVRPTSGTYYWIAGECAVVAGLRRKLVQDLGIPRAQVAFMGYWRKTR